MDKHLTRPFSATVDGNGVACFDSPVIFNLGLTTVSKVNIKTVKVSAPDKRAVALTILVSKLSVEQILSRRRRKHDDEDWPFSKKNVGDLAYGVLNIQDNETCVMPIDHAGCQGPRDAVDLIDSLPPKPANPMPLVGSSYSVDGKIRSPGKSYLPGDSVYGFVALVYQIGVPAALKKKKA